MIRTRTISYIKRYFTHRMLPRRRRRQVVMSPLVLGRDVKPEAQV